MKNVIIFGLLVCFCTFYSCKKETEIKGTRDLKNLSLPQLKSFLDGKWKWQQSVTFTIAGVDTINNVSNSFILFYPLDSLMQIFDNRILIREKLQYEYLSLPGTGGKFAYVFKWGHNGLDYAHKWVADRLINDTLIFENHFRSEGVDQYSFTKE